MYDELENKYNETTKLIVESYYLLEIMGQPQFKMFMLESDRLKVMNYLKNLSEFQDKIKLNEHLNKTA